MVIPLFCPSLHYQVHKIGPRMLTGSIFILLTSPLQKQPCPAAACSLQEGPGWCRGSTEQQVLLLRPMSWRSHLGLMGNPRSYFCHISFLLTSMNFQNGPNLDFSLQRQLKTPVLRWKRLQTTLLPHLLKWNHKLEEILWQIKPTDLQFIPSLHNWCALKYVFLKISLKTANLKP